MDEYSELSINEKYILDSDFYDQHELELNYGSMSALDIYLQLVSLIHEWVDFLMLLRNKFVSLFGLKNLGSLNNVKGL